jgi:hypothetical protein
LRIQRIRRSLNEHERICSSAEPLERCEFNVFNLFPPNFGRMITMTSSLTTCCSKPMSGLWRCRAVMVAWLAILGIVHLSAESASASCGDYLLHSGMDQHQGFVNSSPLNFPLADVGPNGSIPLQPAAPCNGPHCRSQSLPVAPLPVPTNPSPDTETAALMLALSAPVPQGVAAVHPQSEREPVRCGCPLFRPPCA